MDKFAVGPGPLNDKGLGRNLQLGSMFDGRYLVAFLLVFSVFYTGKTNIFLMPLSGRKILSRMKRLSTTEKR